MKKNVSMTPVEELIMLIEMGTPLDYATKKRLIKDEKKNVTDAYNLDPEIMKCKYRNANQWYYEKYGI